MDRLLTGRPAAMSGPVVISGLACHFDPETRNLVNGETATRYTGGQMPD